jgi:hypothetical protein
MAIEKSTFGETREDGSKVILPETKTTVKNIRTGEEYSNMDVALADVTDENTDTIDEEISQSIVLSILKGVESEEL